MGFISIFCSVVLTSMSSFDPVPRQILALAISRIAGAAVCASPASWSTVIAALVLANQKWVIAARSSTYLGVRAGRPWARLLLPGRFRVRPEHLGAPTCAASQLRNARIAVLLFRACSAVR